jgi:DNA (cytosine-5)-methyltransferase 1
MKKEYAQPSNEPTLISLFAGAGGLDIGLEQAGFSTLAVNELEAYGCETLRQNKILSGLTKTEFAAWFSHQMTQRCYGTASAGDQIALQNRLSRAAGRQTMLSRAAVIEGDIRNVSSQELLERSGKRAGEVTLVAGGPPCQPFSRAGKRETVEIADGRLFLEFVRIVREVRPRWFLFENVKGLAQSRTTVPYHLCKACGFESIIPFEKRGNALDGTLDKLICQRCLEPGDEVHVKDVRGGSLEIILSEFESIGYRCHHKILNSAHFGVPQSRERLFIVGSRDNEVFRFPDPTHFDPNEKSAKGLNKGEQLSLLDLDSSLQPRLSVKDVLWKNGHPEFGQLDYNKAVLWVKNVVRPHDEPVCWSLHRPSPTVGAHQAAKLAIAPEGVPDAQLARQQWHTKGRRQSDLPPVHVRHSMLSDEELLLLQTFPSFWYLHGTRMQRAFQIGNAVPPTLAMHVGRAILKCSNFKSINHDTREVAIA